MRRAGCFVAGMLFVLLALVAAVSWLLTTAFGSGWMSGILLIVLVLVAAAVLRGAWHAFRVRVAPLGDLIDASQRIEAGEIGTQVDVRGPSEMRALSRAFNAMSSRLAADTEERRRLLADVSHELRTPLTVIQGNVEGMLDGLYPADREHLERVLAETRQMERLIEDLRTLSLADTGSLPLHREPVDLAGLAAEVIAGFQPQAQAGGVTLDLETALADLPQMSLDPRRIRQVLGNLVSNALRHTPNGGRVTVSVQRRADAVELSVSDTGTGMDAATAARAFDRFWRSGDTAGAGLGLAIVRDLVRAHGGEVSLRSVPDSGTVVRCRFPFSD
ncbi:MAG: HAMP domain-containing histidine kinase [Chloroflexota bacterium]|nr:HAMP domain-containing histidine kinase [Chloroflexota bacterium]